MYLFHTAKAKILAQFSTSQTRAHRRTTNLSHFDVYGKHCYGLLTDLEQRASWQSCRYRRLVDQFNQLKDGLSWRIYVLLTFGALSDIFVEQLGVIPPFLLCTSFSSLRLSFNLCLFLLYNRGLSLNEVSVLANTVTNAVSLRLQCSPDLLQNLRNISD
jgi:hypothetical protein